MGTIDKEAEMTFVFLVDARLKHFHVWSWIHCSVVQVGCCGGNLWSLRHWVMKCLYAVAKGSVLVILLKTLLYIQSSDTGGAKIMSFHSGMPFRSRSLSIQVLKY